MKISIETVFAKDGKTTDRLTLLIDSKEIQKIEKNKGTDSANVAIDKMLYRLSNDVKKKLVDILK